MTRSRIPALLWAVAVSLLLAHQAWLWLGERVRPDTDILALLPVQKRDPVVQQSFTHMVDAAQQRVIVLVGAADWAAARRAADAYRSVLAADPEALEYVLPGGGSQDEWLAPFMAHRLGFVTARQEKLLETEPPRYWVQGAIARLYSAFSGPKPGSFQDDPFGLFSAWAQERAQETPVRPRDGELFVASATHEYVLIPLTLKLPAFSLAAQQRVLPLLERASEAARQTSPGVDTLSAGVILHAGAAGAQASREMATIGAGSVLGIILLAWLTFGSLRPVALVLLSVTVGFLGAFSVCWLLFGRIHLLTLVFGASLIGVAQDYGVYFLCHRLGAAAETDPFRLLRRLLPGLALTLCAAVIGYLGLLLTPFPGLRHMAVFSVLGLIFAWLTVVCWFPLLSGGGARPPGMLARIYGRALRRWPRFRSGRAGFAALSVFVGIVAYAGFRTSFNDDLRALQNSPAHLVEDQIRLGRLLDLASPVQYYLVRGASAEEVLQREERLKTRLDVLIQARQLGGYHALSNWAPSAQAQARRRALVERTLLGEGGALAQLGAQVGEDDAWAAGVRQHLSAAQGGLTVDAFLATAASQPWRHLWLGQVGAAAGQYASIVALRGLEYPHIPALKQAAQDLDGVQWVDRVEEISALLGGYRVYMSWVLAGAYLLVSALLYLRYRRQAWRVIAPVLLASLGTVALFGLLAQSLQLFHVLALMLLLGVGVDYGIFMQEEGGRRSLPAWLAVGLSAANTLLAFGLLSLSRTPALQAFGLTMLAGITLVWLLTPCFSGGDPENRAAQEG